MNNIFVKTFLPAFLGGVLAAFLYLTMAGAVTWNNLITLILDAAIIGLAIAASKAFLSKRSHKNDNKTEGMK